MKNVRGAASGEPGTAAGDPAPAVDPDPVMRSTRCRVGSRPARPARLLIETVVTTLPPVVTVVDRPALDPCSGRPEAPVTPPGLVPLTLSVQRRKAGQCLGKTSVTDIDAAS